MLAFSVKIIWFVLSLTGLVGCWAVLSAFARAVGTVWGPYLYIAGCTLLQAIFCLGMIYRMDPFAMPRSFCIAQTTIIGFATFLLTGVAGAFSVATTVTVHKPKTWGDEDQVALKWRRVYLIPIAVFPVLATGVHVAFVLAYDSAQPSDDLHCDSSHPIWVRFMGYAGLPVVVSIPCLFLSIKSIIRVYKTNQHIQRARHDDVAVDHLSPLPRTRSKDLLNFVSAGRAIPSPSPSAKVSRRVSVGREALSPEISSPVLMSRRFHLPFTRGIGINEVGERDERDSSTSSIGVETDRESTVSSSFPTFANPTTPPTVESAGHGGRERERCGSGLSVVLADARKEDWRDALNGGIGGRRLSGGNGRRLSGGNSRRLSGGNGRRFSASAGTVVVDGDHAHVGGDMDKVSSVIDWEGAAEEGRKSEYKFKGKELELEEDDDMTDVLSEEVYTPRHTSFGMPHKRRPAPRNLAPAIWRIILFQVAFSTIQILMCISTIVDVARGAEEPTPLGTQHFALLLAAWGPVLVFG
ncbi:hypothetical protein BDQ12DRAFT_720495 [Crucibulum laeve]|uniref:Uncharacterized protein n=1 Tax=Crucibulum laeve TaxID=68775 RepID=A0A5C3M8L7_9AGAR|nr:hypothetical protein BDQ12DRAFT_720495 [Crucibulum laeve]